MNERQPGFVEVQRACPVVLVPSGRRAVLAAGEHVEVLQRLGGSITVRIGHGTLARVAGVDAAALGIEPDDGDGGTDVGAGEVDADGGIGVIGRAEAGGGVPDVDAVLDRLRGLYDPEIPVNVVDLGLIYGCEVHPMPSGGHRVAVRMSMTAPGCGMGDILRAEAAERILAIPGVTDAEVELVFDPPWDLDRMSEAARLQLGLW
jgi:metal-sulfur cluster biosynthetic enzyme